MNMHIVFEIESDVCYEMLFIEKKNVKRVSLLNMNYTNVVVLLYYNIIFTILYTGFEIWNSENEQNLYKGEDLKKNE